MTAAVAMALATYGPTPASEALLRALALPRPEGWAEAMEEEE